MTNGLYILGAGTYGEAIFDLAEQCGYDILGFFDDDTNKQNEYIFGKKVLGNFSDFFEMDLDNINAAVAIGNNNIRNKMLKDIREKGGNTPTLIHSTVTITKNCHVGKGVYIQPNATLWTSVKIENNCIVSPGVIIAHHSTLKEGVFVSQLSNVGAGIIIEEEVFVGMGSTLVTGTKKIGKKSIVGAGAVVINDVIPFTVVAGVPAKKIRDVEISINN